jgi:hypothetical protein
VLLAISVAVAAASVVASIGAPADLGIGSTRLEPAKVPDLVLVLTGDVPADSRVFAVSEDVITAQVEADPAVASVSTSHAGKAGAEAGRAVLAVQFDDVSEDERQRAVERLSERIDPGSLRVSIGGETATLIAAKRSLGGDLWRVELLVFALALLAMAAAVGPRLIAAPILTALIAVAGTLAILRVLGLIADISLLGIAPAAVVGTVLGIELPSMLVAMRQEEALLSVPTEALRRAVVEGGRRAAVIAGAASLPALGLLATSLDQAPSLALGCALAACLAAASAIVTTPALIQIVGAPGDAGVSESSAQGSLDTGPSPGRLRRLPGVIASGRVRLAGALVTGAAPLVALTVGALDGTSSPLAPSDLPAGSGARSAAVAADIVVGAGESLFGELPLAAAIAGALLAVAAVVAVRRWGALLVAPAALLVAAAGVGAGVLVFQQGHLADLLDLDARASLDTAAVATSLCALAAVGAARGAAALAACRAERRLGVAPDGAAELAGAFTLPGVAAATVAAGAMAGALVAADLYTAKEFGFAVAAGLVLDLLLIRVPLLAALARWGS